VNPAGTEAWVPNSSTGNISVIDTATNTVTGTISLGGAACCAPSQVVFNPSGSTAYVSDLAGRLEVVDTATRTVTAAVPTGSRSFAVVLNPAFTRAYVANGFANTVSVVDLATNTVAATIADGSGPRDVGITPTGSTLYVTDIAGNDVSVIDTATNTVTSTVPVGAAPFGLGILTRFTVPVVTAVSPSSGPQAGGNVVTVTGSGFTLASQVLFGGVPATSFTISGDTVITAVAPAHVAGTVDVTVSAPAGTSATGPADQYSYVFAFAGFLDPVDNPPTVNMVHAGQSVPIKFSVGGDFGLDIIAPGSPTSQQVSCASGVPVNTATATATAGSSGLQFDPGTGVYTYVWKTSKSSAGTCEVFTLTLVDGTSHVADFQYAG
jgi:YVTN family beta-propeller protein